MRTIFLAWPEDRAGCLSGICERFTREQKLVAPSKIQLLTVKKSTLPGPDCFSVKRDNAKHGCSNARPELQS